MIYGVSIVGPVERLKEKGIDTLVSILQKKCREIDFRIRNLS